MTTKQHLKSVKLNCGEHIVLIPTYQKVKEMNLNDCWKCRERAKMEGN